MLSPLAHVSLDAVIFRNYEYCHEHFYCFTHAVFLSSKKVNKTGLIKCFFEDKTAVSQKGVLFQRELYSKGSYIYLFHFLLSS